MFGFGEHHDSYQQVYGQQEHEGKFSHELIAGAASFEAMKMFEDRQRSEGKTVSHAFAKEMLAGIAGGEVDKLFETKGLDYIDREEAKRQAQNNAVNMYEQHYGGEQQYDPSQQSAPQELQQYGNGRW
ncbi:hypothetical protein BCR37DRAFT_404896 [Protomyces lactucae-debilis]|uniref:CipC-like antibiotic response protein n=1 Tax=Protomyces lactucae-debilis TaxID=2754530 RepID=A0A1Y2F956_PROLT|nr:uncharacterized protein BCR37DRAFT_404896 [Protomyces lactucae-debilis]ORY80429.1 hypothetical protein BCR37DRAFT_404896 [Protomyces lactucae-debilis]